MADTDTNNNLADELARRLYRVVYLDYTLGMPRSYDEADKLTQDRFQSTAKYIIDMIHAETEESHGTEYDARPTP